VLAWDVEVLLAKEPVVSGRILKDFGSCVRGTPQEQLYRATFALTREAKRVRFPHDDRVVAAIYKTRADDGGFRLTVEVGMPREYLSP